MPSHPFRPPRGRIETIVVDSRALAGNMLGDPSTRQVAVYVPHGHEHAGSAALPLFVALAGFTSSGLRMLSWQAFGESVPQRLDRLVEAGRMGPVVLAFPDCFTSLGGNQYVNSVALGRFEDFLVGEMIPEIERRFPVRTDAGGRAVFGKSSGGYGALIQALRHAEHWGAVACHSGDIDFDLCYRPALAAALDVLARHGSEPLRLVEHLRGARKIAPAEMQALMLFAMCASYDPDPRAPLGVRLPVDPHTCELLPERWGRWLAHDPLRLVDEPRSLSNLRSLRALFLDCGTRDPYALHYGARAFVRRLEAAGVPHVYEEFDDDHSGIDYRLDRSLPLLYGAVARA
jgi:hypothetical protein